MMDSAMNESPTPGDTAKSEAHLRSYLKLETRGLGLAARGKKLKPGDVLVAIDGEAFTGDAEMLAKRMGRQVTGNEDNPEVDAAEDGVSPHLLTFWRDSNFYHVIFETRLKAAFEATGAEETLAITQRWQAHVMAPLDTYKNFEVFRDVRKNAALHAIDNEEIATIAPALWMLNHRLFYPLMGVCIIYGITIVAHWLLFIISYFLVSVYTKRAQIDLLRSYKLFEDKFFWMVLAEPSESEARATCKRFIPDLKFQFEANPKPKKKSREANRLRVRPQNISSESRENPAIG
jgi:hypothetical protein